MIKQTQTPQRRAGYRLEAIEDEVLLFHPGQTRILYCNQTASLIWQLCDGERTVQEIIALLAQAYPDAASDIAQDIESTLQMLEDHGAITLD
jgi:coenzyme PQQ biosynthesis protein PqqD